jgi:signal transduction histidine kinase
MNATCPNCGAKLSSNAEQQNSEILEIRQKQEQFLVSMAHELDLPITGMIASAEVAIELTGAKQKEALEHLIREAQLLSLKVNTLLSVLPDRTPRRIFTRRNLRIPLINARDLFQREAIAKGCYIKMPVALNSDGFPDIQISSDDIETAFKNLVHNAVKYSYNSSNDSRRYVSIIGRWANKERTQYTVDFQNYGVGITQDEILSRSIFDSYVRGELSTDRSRTGAGFGLAHARRVVEDLHHGAIRVESVEQVGGAYLTTFSVTLPLSHNLDSAALADA